MLNRQRYVNKLRRLDLAMIIGLLLTILFTNISTFGQQCDTVRQDVVRLHIIANSDSENDQRVKLLVRDAILENLGTLFEQPQSKDDAKYLAQRELPEIKKIAQSVLKENGIDTKVNAAVCHMYFNTRHYDAFSLPAGYYDAVRVTIGDGAGRNWWCVMYPPLCIPAARKDTPSLKDSDSTGVKQAENEIEDLNNQPMLKPKLAVVELFESLFA